MRYCTLLEDLLQWILVKPFLLISMSFESFHLVWQLQFDPSYSQPNTGSLQSSPQPIKIAIFNHQIPKPNSAQFFKPYQSFSGCKSSLNYDFNVDECCQK